MIDNFRDIAPEYFQNYLNEYCRKLNGRYFSEACSTGLLLQRLRIKIGLCITRFVIKNCKLL